MPDMSYNPDMNNKDGTFVGLLAKLHWSQNYFAERVGISERTVKRWAKAEDNSTGKRVAVKYLTLISKCIGD